MKHKFSLCFRPVPVEAEDAVVSHDHHVSYDSVSTKIVPGGNTGMVSSSSSVSGRKNPKLIRRKRVAFKHFPSLFKAIVFPDPMKNIHQLELQLKSKGPVKNRKPFHVLDSDEPGKPETITEAENQPEENSAAIDLLTWSSSSSTSSSTSESKTQRSSHEKPITTSCSSRMSCFCAIVLALLATIFLGKIGAIVSISLGMSAFHWLIGYFRPPLDMMKSEMAAPIRGKSLKYDKDNDGDYYVAPQCRIL